MGYGFCILVLHYALLFFFIYKKLFFRQQKHRCELGNQFRGQVLNRALLRVWSKMGYRTFCSRWKRVEKITEFCKGFGNRAAHPRPSFVFFVRRVCLHRKYDRNRVLVVSEILMIISDFYGHANRVFVCFTAIL